MSLGHNAQPQPLGRFRLLPRCAPAIHSPGDLLELTGFRASPNEFPPGRRHAPRLYQPVLLTHRRSPVPVMALCVSA